jgi:hypothetical protein
MTIVGVVLALIGLMGAGSGCGLLPQRGTAGLQATELALGIQATTMAIQVAAQGAAPAAPEAAQPVAAAGAQETVVAAQATQIAVQAAQLAQLSTQQAAPPPTTPPTIAPPTLSAVEATLPAGDAPSADLQLEQRIKAAKILLFEDISGSGKLRYVKTALDQAGYSYVDVGSAQGWFKTRLLSDEKWDLIIASSEASGRIQGEYFDYLHDQLKRGAAVVIELWELDEVYGGRAAPLLADCGVKFNKDWNNPAARAIFWVNADHPIFHVPNDLSAGMRTRTYWYGDVGDIQQVRGGDAIVLATTSNLSEKDLGVLTTCMQGRMILQTFSSHEYMQEDIQHLWQNYVYNALRAHFEHGGS